MQPVKEITLESLLTSYDWENVFGEKGCYGGGNVGDETDPCPPGSDVDTAPPTRKDVKEIIAAVNGQNDEESWIGVFLLRDGRYLFAYGWCDYTGWD